MRTAIIGANGYIGRHLEFYLKQKGIVPMCYDMQEELRDNYARVDLTSKKSIKRIDLDVDYIYMFAGLTGTYSGFDRYESYFNVNEIGLLNLLDAIRKSVYRPKIVYPSTRLVYKGMDKPLKEEDEKETRTPYAVNKLACEGILYAYNKSFDIPYTVFRICVPYGNMLSTDYSFGTIGFFIKQARSGNNIPLYGGGNAKRTFTHIEDLCCQVVRGALTKRSNGEVYNIGGQTLSLKAAAEIVADRCGVKVVAVEWPDRDLRIESGHTYFDDKKIRTLLGYGEYKRLEEFSKDI
ncbi:NAD-dependent epimerase/dehydratase family protein [Alistipes finegoldii]|jgi:UDP-glucose 4-epimerase|uniref:NAD-dependent epimerase/dehydratase family protein n=1 Tax=Alistipes finegoldii TaxID=214856 RepID=UPI00248BC1AB|nr:NAD(P)-dependent oxidoreductase [Alistipes finegoldii]